MAQLLSQDAQVVVTTANLLERLDLERLDISTASLSIQSGVLISGNSSPQQAWLPSWRPCSRCPNPQRNFASLTPEGEAASLCPLP